MKKSGMKRRPRQQKNHFNKSLEVDQAKSDDKLERWERRCFGII